jgi:chromosome partitioning protein
MSRSVIISILNHKGGVGKTTSTANIGAGLHQAGQRVLLVDFDPQANLSLHLYGESVPGDRTIYGALRGEYLLPVIEIKSGLDLVLSTLDLSAAEIELQSEPGREYILRELLMPLTGRYDYILIDCPPSLGLLTINALSTSTQIIIPVEASTFALKGMTKLFDIIDKVKVRLNKRLSSYRFLITKYDSRKTIQREIAVGIQSQYADKVFHTSIRTNVALEEATMKKCSIFDLDPKSAGAEDYQSVCSEIISTR